jgi:hypothetical protein
MSELPVSVEPNEGHKPMSTIRNWGAHLMRQELPYGVWICDDGAEVLFNRDCSPIWRRTPDGQVAPAHPQQKIEYVAHKWFFHDSSPPWRDRRCRKHCEKVLDDFKCGRPLSELPPAPSTRRQIWRNIMVATINAGLAQGLFSLRPVSNSWAGKRGVFYEFTFAPSIYAVSRVYDIGYGELRFETVLFAESLRLELLKRLGHSNVDVLLGPGRYCSRWVKKHCYANASGWLERQKGAWLQDSDVDNRTRLSCREPIIPIVLGAKQQPRGYADHGPRMT